MCVNSWPIAKSFFSWLTQMEGWAGLHMTGFTSSGQWVSHSCGQRLIPPLCLLQFYWDRSFHCTSYRVLVPCSASHERKTTVAWGAPRTRGHIHHCKDPRDYNSQQREAAAVCLNVGHTAMDRKVPVEGNGKGKAHSPLEASL